MHWRYIYLEEFQSFTPSDLLNSSLKEIVSHTCQINLYRVQSITEIVVLFTRLYHKNWLLVSDKKFPDKRVFAPRRLYIRASSGFAFRIEVEKKMSAYVLAAYWLLYF